VSAGQSVLLELQSVAGHIECINLVASRITDQSGQASA